MAGNEFDLQVLNTTIMGVVASDIGKMLGIKSTVDPVVVEKQIIEYNGRMRLFPMEKFNGPCYVAVIGFYMSQKDLDALNARGMFALYVKEDYLEKFLRAFNRSLKDSEHEDVMLDICGEVCNIFAGNVKNEFVNLGYADLTISAPSKYKNHVPDGAPFDFELFKKQEITFTYWGQKCIVVEACMGYLPTKSR